MASSVVKFIPLCGAKSEDPLCYLLEIDDYTILLDCGWNDDFDEKLLEPLSRVAKDIDAVFISHGDMEHIGALAYAISKLGLQNANLYCTWPVYQMGHLAMYDVFHSHFIREDFKLFSLQDIDAAFGRFQHLRFNENMSLPGKGSGISVTPYRAGHTLGGTIWHIRKDAEDIVYAVDYNHMKERHLDGATFDAFSKPGILITDARNSLEQLKMRKLRDAELIDNIISTLRRGGNVLLPIDSASRVLELTLLLDATWNMQSFTYPVILLSNVCGSLTHAARVMLEWTSEAIHRTFETKRENAFEFKSVTLVTDVNAVLQMNVPCVVLASTETLSSSFSLDLLVAWAGNPLHQIILTQRAHKGSLARLLKTESPTELRLKLKKKILLEGDEKIAFLKKEEEEKQRKKTGKGSRDSDDDDEDDDEDEEEREENEEEQESDEGEQQQQQQQNLQDSHLNGGGLVGKIKHKSKLTDGQDGHRKSIVGSKDSINVSSLEDKSTIKRKTTDKLLQHDIVSNTSSKTGGYFKQTRQYTMFPVIEKRVRFDDYGEFIRFEDYQLENVDGTKDSLMPSTGEKEDEEMENKLKKETAMNEKKELEEIQLPTKSIIMEKLIERKCDIFHVDFEGLSDGRSKKTLLTQVAPKRIILIHGTPAETEALRDYFMNAKELTKEVFTPNVLESVDFSTALSVYQIKLTDALMTSLQFSKVNEYDLAYIHGVLNMKLDDQIVLDIYNEEKEDKMGHPPVLVGDPLLSDFRRLLQKEGFQADFSEGALVCNNTMAIRKTETGRLVLEGMLTEEYYHVRDLLYEQFAIL